MVYITVCSHPSVLPDDSIVGSPGEVALVLVPAPSWPVDQPQMTVLIILLSKEYFKEMVQNETTKPS